MEKSIPIALLFDATVDDVARGISALIDSDDEIFHYERVSSAGSYFRLLYRGMEFCVSVDSNTINTDDYFKVFCASSAPVVKATINIALGENLSMGQLIAPITLNLLMFAAGLATNLGATAVAWNPSRLLTDPAYFSTTVAAYAEGGAFPVLSTVRLDFTAATLTTSGLKWFAGQELELKAVGLSQAEMVRRAVRIVHDIATNGAVLVCQDIPDLDQGQLVRLNPSPEGDQVFAEIISEMDHLPV